MKTVYKYIVNENSIETLGPFHSVVNLNRNNAI